MPLFIKEKTTVMFVHIPKCGGTAIENAFRNSGWEWSYLNEPMKSGYDEIPCNPQHYHNELIERFIMPLEMVDFVFAVVRNPYTRMISEMLWQSNWSDHVKNNGFDEEFFNAFDNFGINRLQAFKVNELQYQMDKEAFMRNDHKFVFDNHMRPQHHFIGDDWNIYWYEELEEEGWPTLEHEFDIKSPGIQNTNLDRNIERPTYYNKHSDKFKELFTEFYYQDCKVFGYELPF